METSNTGTQTSHLSCVFQVKRLPPGSSALPERSVTLLIPPPGMLQPEVHPDAPQPPSGSQLRPYPQHQPHAGPSSAAGEPTVVPSHRGSPLHLSADSALSSSSLPGRGSTLNPPDFAAVGRKCHPNVTSTGRGGEWQLSLTPPLR